MIPSRYQSRDWSVRLVLLAIAVGWGGTAQAQEPGPDPYLTAHRPQVPGVNGLVTGGHPLASVTGARILMMGGNAVDAAVAIGAVLNVVRPEMSGAGGNSFFTIYDEASGEVVSMNATGAAPMALRPETLSADELSEGVKAGIVPGTFGGWVAMLQRYGTMTLGDLLTPAIEYAEGGFPIEAALVERIRQREDIFQRHPSSRAQFLPAGSPPEPKERFRMPALAGTFRKVVEAEARSLEAGRSREEALQAAYDRFYTGDIAEEIDRFHRENGGLISIEDLARYRPIWAEPLHTSYRGYDVYSSPSTSRGGFEVVMGLNLLEGYDLASMDRYGVEVLHLIVEAIKISKSDIYRYVADPAFTEVELTDLLTEDFTRERRELLDRTRAIDFPPGGTLAGAAPDEMRLETASAGTLPRFPERSRAGSTDSYSVVDRWGNAVSATPTHGSAFGTGVVVGNTGLTLNNGMRIGSTSPYPDHVNYPEAGKIPILNNAPTLVFHEGQLLAALGTPGGEAIGQAQLQVVLNLLDFGMNIQEAIEAPRLALVADPNFYRAGAQVTVHLENRIAPEVVEALRVRGHAIQLTPGFTTSQNMQGILVNPKTGAMTAGADPRRSGYAIGF